MSTTQGDLDQGQLFLVPTLTLVTGPGFNVVCCLCQKRVTHGPERPPVYADSAGESYKAYYCAACAAVIDPAAALRAFEERLKAHDWRFEWSDDMRYWRAGSRDREDLRSMAQSLPRDEAQRLIDKYKPADVRW